MDLNAPYSEVHGISGKKLQEIVSDYPDVSCYRCRGKWWLSYNADMRDTELTLKIESEWTIREWLQSCGFEDPWGRIYHNRMLRAEEAR